MPTHLTSHRSQSVHDFLSKTNYKQTLIQQALQKSTADKEPSQQPSKLREMSQKYGISLQTLQLIQKKKEATDVSMNITRQNADASSTASKLAALQSLVCSLHHQFMMAGKKALPLQ